MIIQQPMVHTVFECVHADTRKLWSVAEVRRYTITWFIKKYITL